MKVPEHLNYVQACTSVITGVTAWHCLYGHPGAVLASGQTVLVLGTGGVSIYAAQLALAAGCRVIATSSSDEKLERVKKELGVQEIVNYRKNPEWEKEVIEKNGGRGVDHVIESESNYTAGALVETDTNLLPRPVGGAGTLVRSIRSCCPGGNVWVVG